MNLEHIANRAGTALVGAYMRLALDLSIEQPDPLPPGPKIFTANHPTTTDPFYLLPLADEPMSILVAEIAFKAPIFGTYLQAAGHIPVRHGQGRAAFEAALERLRSGGSVGIFPEGSLEPWDGGTRIASTGAVRLALASGAPVIPAGIALDPAHIRYRAARFEDLSDTARWYIDGPYAMTVGAPRRATGSADDWTSVRTQSDELMRIIDGLERESASRLYAQQTPPLDAIVRNVMQIIPRIMVGE